MAQRRIADRRIYGYDSRGRHVLVAAKGQPIPEGFEPEARPQTQAGPDLESLTVSELRELASRRGIEGISEMRKAELVDALS